MPSTRSAQLAAALLSLAVTTPSLAQVTPDAQAQLMKRLEQLASELEKVKSELQQMKAAQAATAAAVAAAPAPAATLQSSPTSTIAPATQLSSYGEINYNRPTKNSAAAQADIRRFVLGYQHRFDERTKVVAELEVEHAVSSADDPGEVEVEQVYVEHRLNETYGLRAGLFLMPLGLLNQNHEPTAFYGVERNFVETRIIPSTWREGGVQIFGEHDNGISWSAGISTGFDLGKWDATSSEGRESPLGAIHQEMALAKSRDLSVFGAVDWRGIPGLRLGGGIFTGKASHGAEGFAAPSARITLWDLHARWTPGAWDLSGVYARGSISGAAALNQTFAGAIALVPRTFDGWYLQAAYKWRLGGDYALAPFARIERVNTGRSFAGVVQGLNPDSYDTEGIFTVGANFNLNPSVVLKADYQRFKIARDANRINLGLGFSF
jgi:hypothetical protein